VKKKMLEEIEQLKKYIDLAEAKINYHQRQIERWQIEINKTQIAIENIRKKQTTITDFKTAQELLDEQGTNL